MTVTPLPASAWHKLEVALLIAALVAAYPGMCANGFEASPLEDVGPYSTPSRVLHVGHEQLNKTNGRDNVDRIQARPFVSGAFEPRVLRVYGRIVHKDIHAAERGTSLFRQRDDVVGNGQIGFDEHCACAPATKFIDELIAAGLVSTMDGN